MHNQKKANLYGLATVLLWSTVASAFKLSLRYLDHIQLLFYASIASILVLTFILIVQGKIGLLFTCTRRQYLRSLFLGLLNPCLYYLVLFKAYDLLPAQEAQPLNYTWAITLALLSVPLLKQKIRLKNFAALFVSYAGVVVISTHGSPFSLRFSDPLGVVLALGSTVIWSVYWIYNTKDERDPVAALLLNFLFALPFVTVLCLSFSSLRVPSIMGILGAAYVGIFEMGITFVLWLSALRLSRDTARVGNLIFISPFLSLVFIHYFVGEEILVSTYFGLVLIIAGLLIQQIRGRRS
ncbi:DMT family transporter [Thermodesulfobacteriota bacterium]